MLREITEDQWLSIYRGWDVDIAGARVAPDIALDAAALGVAGWRWRNNTAVEDHHLEQTCRWRAPTPSPHALPPQRNVLDLASTGPSDLADDGHPEPVGLQRVTVGSERRSGQAAGEVGVEGVEVNGRHVGFMV